MPEWTGTIVEKGETAKSFKWTGKTPDGKTNTFWQGKDNKPLPMNEPLTITYKINEYDRAGEKVQSKWVEGYTAAQPPVQGHKSNGALPYGFIDIGHQNAATGVYRTLPTVREQFIMRMVETGLRTGLVQMDVDSIMLAIDTAKKAWAQGVESPPVQEVGTPFNDEPPVPRPEDYGMPGYE